ncbi:MAG: hypothetical protein D6734_09955 [Candidatus Schekmanbacteria bacterium]|nr:MAG: hypothetical protein D6734_09955 [Candidatus Schekmanbacteria bacterium]
MRFDHLIVRLTTITGPEWLMAYALIDLNDDVDVDEFRFKVPDLLDYHHETEKYLGGVPGDLFIGFFAHGQTHLFDEISKIKSWKEVKEVKEWAIVNFPTTKVKLSKLDWKVVKSLRSGAEKTAEQIAEELGEKPEIIQERLDYIKNIPLTFHIEPPNNNNWTFTEIHIDFKGTTFKEKMEELSKIGKPFGATGSKSQGALMVEPKTVDELKEMIKKVSEIPGVKVRDYAFCEDMIWKQPWLDKFIDERIAEAED